jgi:hypothetical protein
MTGAIQQILRRCITGVQIELHLLRLQGTSMKALTFNIYAFARPNTQAEVLALLDEALRMADELGATIDCMGKIMESATV